MGSTFGSLALFDSGPHRFTVGRLGRLTRGPYVGSNQNPYTVDNGTRELIVIQMGRLVAADDAALWTLIDAVQSEAEAAMQRTLTDHHGRAWTGMRMILFQAGDRIDRGREVSLAYEVRYLEF